MTRGIAYSAGELLLAVYEPQVSMLAMQFLFLFDFTQTPDKLGFNGILLEQNNRYDYG